MKPPKKQSTIVDQILAGNEFSAMRFLQEAVHHLLHKPHDHFDEAAAWRLEMAARDLMEEAMQHAVEKTLSRPRGHGPLLMEAIRGGRLKECVEHARELNH